MKFKIYYCPVCESRITQVLPTVYFCKKCNVYIELTGVNYNSNDKKISLEYTFTEKDRYEGRD